MDAGNVDAVAQLAAALQARGADPEVSVALEGVLAAADLETLVAVLGVLPFHVHPWACVAVLRRAFDAHPAAAPRLLEALVPGDAQRVLYECCGAALVEPSEPSAVAMKEVLGAVLQASVPGHPEGWGCPIHEALAPLLRAVRGWGWALAGHSFDLDVAAWGQWWAYNAINAPHDAIRDVVERFDLYMVLNLQLALQWVADRDFGNALDGAPFARFVSTALVLVKDAFVNGSVPVGSFDGSAVPTIGDQLLPGVVQFLGRCAVGYLVSVEGGVVGPGPLLQSWLDADVDDAVTLVYAWLDLCALALHWVSSEPEVRDLVHALGLVSGVTVLLEGTNDRWQEACICTWYLPVWVLGSLADCPLPKHVVVVEGLLTLPADAGRALLDQARMRVRMEGRVLDYYIRQMDIVARFLYRTYSMAPALWPALWDLVAGDAGSIALVDPVVALRLFHDALPARWQPAALADADDDTVDGTVVDTDGIDGQ